MKSVVQMDTNIEQNQFLFLQIILIMKMLKFLNSHSTQEILTWIMKQVYLLVSYNFANFYWFLLDERELLIWWKILILHFHSKGCTLLLRSSWNLLLHPSTEELCFSMLQASTTSFSTLRDMLVDASEDMLVRVTWSNLDQTALSKTLHGITFTIEEYNSELNLAVEFERVIENEDWYFVKAGEEEETKKQDFDIGEPLEENPLDHKGFY